MKLINISKLLIALSLVAAASCGKRLDVEPRQSIDATNALENDDDVDAAMVGAYSIMGGPQLYGTSLMLDGDLLGSYFPSTEQYASWAGTFPAQRQVGRKQMDRNNSEVARVWTAGYRAINMANTVIDALGVVKDADLKSQLNGEALFVRGIMHFELVRLFAKPWGFTANNTQLGIVIKKTATKTEDQAFEKLPRNTVAEVYTSVIQDLKDAAGLLPETNGTRASKYTALAFLARVYLQQGDYVNARNAASEVIESGNYKMNASVRAAFDNKNTPESIFEIQQNDQNNAGTANDGMATFYASLNGVGRGDVRISSAFVNSYNSADLRQSEWYYVGIGNRPGFLYCSKWKTFSQNLPVVRIAEMYLIRAECNIRLSTSVGDTPANDLAEVRNPVRVNLATIAAPTLTNVLNERAYELAFEGYRIHEAKRLKASFGTYTWSDDVLVFPIPQREIDATDGILVQNSGY
ncbi:MAG: RagB/SusD family nutrient uptake outer membrane protein [Chitinophagaceae bacterium]